MKIIRFYDKNKKEWVPIPTNSLLDDELNKLAIGNLKNLSTTNKNNLVQIINELKKNTDNKFNELFQFGDEINKKLVSGLISKGVTASIKDNITTNVDKVKDIHIPKYDIGDELKNDKFKFIKTKKEIGRIDKFQGKCLRSYGEHAIIIDYDEVNYYNLKTKKQWKYNFKSKHQRTLKNYCGVGNDRIFIISDRTTINGDSEQLTMISTLDFDGNLLELDYHNAGYTGHYIHYFHVNPYTNSVLIAAVASDQLRTTIVRDNGKGPVRHITRDHDMPFLTKEHLENLRIKGSYHNDKTSSNSKWYLFASSTLGTGHDYLTNSKLVRIELDWWGDVMDIREIKTIIPDISNMWNTSKEEVLSYLWAGENIYHLGNNKLLFNSGAMGNGWTNWVGQMVIYDLNKNAITDIFNIPCNNNRTSNKIIRLENNNLIFYGQIYSDGKYSTGKELFIELDPKTLEVIYYHLDISESNKHTGDYGVITSDGYYVTDEGYTGRISYFKGINLQ